MWCSTARIRTGWRGSGHLDIKVAPGLSGDERRTAVESEVERLVELGASVVRRTDEPDGYFVVMQDVEANEFCVT